MPAKRTGIRVALNATGLRHATYVGDPLKLRQMLSNYLGSALKFAHQGEVRTHALELLDGTQKPMLEFSVIENGI